MAYSNQAILQDAVRRNQLLTRGAARSSIADQLSFLYRDQQRELASQAAQRAAIRGLAAEVEADKIAAGVIGPALGDVAGSLWAGGRSHVAKGRPGLEEGWDEITALFGG